MPDLAGAVETAAGLTSGVGVLDQRQQLRVAQRTGRRRSGLGRVVGARSDRTADLGEGAADRLDSETVAVRVEVGDQ
jgi:hypothetical protein